MLVEDDNNLREIYEARLAAEGYEIVSAHDGEEALALAVKEKPDLIISDIMMPKISGFDMLDLLRSTPETKDAKIVMMTALSQAEDKERASKLGADKYLVKSQVTLEDVVRVAKELLDSAAAGPLPAAVTENTPPATPVATPPTSVPVATPPAVSTPAPEPAPAPAAAEPVTAPAAPPVDKPVAAPPAPVVPEPAQPTPAPTTNDVPDTGSTDDPVPAPTATNGSVEDQIKDFISTAEQVKNNASTPPATPTPAKVAPTQIPITDAPGQETAPVEPQLATPSGQKKVIEPINDLSKQGTNLDELLAKEESKPTDDTTPVPSINTVISPDGTLSYATPPPTAAPAPSSPAESGLHTPPTDDTPSAPHEPGQKIDPDSVAP